MRSKIGLIILVLFISRSIADIPGCDYFDTVKLTESQKLPNGSYKYEKIIIPPTEVGEYDYEILGYGEREDVPKHLRGCACKFGNCIRYCCDRFSELVDNERKCSDAIDKELIFDPYVDIFVTEDTKVRKHVFDEFIVQDSLPVPCEGHFHLDKINDHEESDWKLFSNGSLLRVMDQKILSKQEYCLQPHRIDGKDNVTIYMVVPHNCYDQPKSMALYNTLRILSIILMVATCIIYLCIPKLRNLHGYCFVCYMLCFIVAFALLTLENLYKHFSRTGCELNGYIGYFSVMAGFLWLTVISFDLWNSFRGNNYNVQRNTTKMRFAIYSAYAWGVALLLTIIIIVVDKSLDVDNPNHVPWLPGVALYNCWVKTDDWSAMLYFHGIMALQIIFNITMFTLTAIRIVEVKKQLKSMTLPEERKKHSKPDIRTFGMFARLFVIMGIAWTFEIFAYLASNHPTLARFFELFDYLNTAHGIIIFILFVLKPSVLKMIKNRLRGISSPNDEDDSEEEIALQDRNGTDKKIGPNILN